MRFANACDLRICALTCALFDTIKSDKSRVLSLSANDVVTLFAWT
jgi:hypothetical protein